MKLLYDHLRRQMRGTPLAPVLDAATVFFNNDAIRQAVDGTVDLEDLPSLAPPYPVFFVECDLPLTDLSTSPLRWRPAQRVGVLLQAPEYPIGDTRGLETVSGEPYHWLYEMFIFFQGWHVRDCHWMGSALVMLDGDGQALEMRGAGGDGYCHFTRNEPFYEGLAGLIANFKALTVDAYDELAARIIDACLYTVGMLHCRNIGTDVIVPSRAEAHKFERKYGMPLASYHVLKVTGKGASAGAQIGAPTGARRPLHWCRGHFKHYDDSAPLLGHAVGSFYFGAHVRGHADKGVVTKDYDVQVQP